VLVATCLDAGPGLLADHAGQQIVGELLGLVLVPLEGRTPKDAWRQADATWTPKPGPADYLRFLAANGYTLSPIEQVVTGVDRGVGR
jgi:ParB family chromosome partitioning protein